MNQRVISGEIAGQATTDEKLPIGHGNVVQAVTQTSRHFQPIPTQRPGVKTSSHFFWSAIRHQSTAAPRASFSSTLETAHSLLELR